MSRPAPRPSPLAAGLAEAIRAELARPPALTFRGGPLAVQTTTASEWVLEGPSDTTKTTGGLWRVFSDVERTPGCRAVITMRLRATMATTILPTWAKVLKRRGYDREPYGGQEPRWYDFPNGGRVYIAGLDDGDKVLGGEFDIVYGSQLEQWREEPWATIVSRTSGRGAVIASPWVGGDCNPGAASHWILKRRSLVKFHARHEDNPELFDDQGRPTDAYPRRMAALDALPGIRYKRLRLGLWTSAEGTVYDFDSELHLVTREKRPEWYGPDGRPQLPASWRRFRAIDFGYTNPFVCQWWAMDDDGRLYLYRELYRTKRLVEDHARDIVRLSEGERIEATIADHDAEGRATLVRHGGMTTTPATKAVRAGIQAVESRLKVVGDGRPRLMVMEGALVEEDTELVIAGRPTSTAAEFEVYAYPDANAKSLKEEPVKEHDHGMDAMRYLVAHVDGLANDAATLWLSVARQARGKA